MIISLFCYWLYHLLAHLYGLQHPGCILCLKMVIICFSLSHFCDLFWNVTMIMNICFIWQFGGHSNNFELVLLWPPTADTGWHWLPLAASGWLWLTQTDSGGQPESARVSQSHQNSSRVGQSQPESARFCQSQQES